MSASEDVYTGDLLAYPDQWSFDLPRQHIILVSDEQLEQLGDPDQKVDLSLGDRERIESLRDICERCAASGARTLIIAFDHFWNAYRQGQGHAPRRLLPDTDEYIERIAKLGEFAAQYGIGLELSLLSPLELGAGFRKATGQTGRWVQYREGVRDPVTGAFSVSYWRHRRWGNNKGTFALDPAEIRAFAFTERGIGGTNLRSVDPDGIVEITACAALDESHIIPYETGDFAADRVMVNGKGMSDVGDLDRVLIVQGLDTPEIDYFSDDAAGFLHDLMDRYNKAGVHLDGLYSDEMHIQQDWHYGTHHDNGQFNLRYLTDSFAKTYADRFGDEFRDFEKWLVYFCTGQHDSLPGLAASEYSQHVFGESIEDIHRTFLFRARYYELLERSVIDLFVDAKHHAEDLGGKRLAANYHVTWAESPTIDQWESSAVPAPSRKYEYTSAFRWSNTVHQAAAACQDYFGWGDFLTGGGNDHAEGGYADRDYFACALACSQAMLNDVPYSYAAHWGMPKEVSERRFAVKNAYGAAAQPMFKMVQDATPREVDVLMIYPLDLVAVDERFGTWMTQYGYTDYISATKLIEEGRVTGDGGMTIRGTRFTTLVALFEPYPTREMLALMREFAESGGRLIWSGPPPVLLRDGSDALGEWCELFGVEYQAQQPLGIDVPGYSVRFDGALADVDPQVILTHHVVDHVFPLIPVNAEPVAKVSSWIVGTRRALPGGGQAVALGFRPRDDQSGSLGDDTRTWYDILDALGAYPLVSGVRDNTEVLSRTGDCLCTRFANGTTSIALHFKDYAEGWTGGFHRDLEKDAEWLREHPLPSDKLELRDFRVNGHVVTYDGRLELAFRLDDAGELAAFAGHDCTGIVIDGRAWRLSDVPLANVSWAPIPPERRVDGGAVMIVYTSGEGSVRIPWDGPVLEFFSQGSKPGEQGERVSATTGGGFVELTGVGGPIFGVPTE
jgi:hypothetical protein